MEDLVAGVKRSMDWKQLLESITESVDEEVRLRNAYLYAENCILAVALNSPCEQKSVSCQTLSLMMQKQIN